MLDPALRPASLATGSRLIGRGRCSPGRHGFLGAFLLAELLRQGIAACCSGAAGRSQTAAGTAVWHLVLGLFSDGARRHAAGPDRRSRQPQLGLVAADYAELAARSMSSTTPPAM